jgi:hypothetical protein
MKRGVVLGLILGAVALFSLGLHSISSNVFLSLTEAAALGKTGTITTVNKFGRNQDADTTEDSIWDGSDVGGPIRCFDVIGTTAVNLYISSDDENDAALEVTVEYLDSSWDAQTVTQALGAVANATATEFVQLGGEKIMRVNRAYATDTALTGNVYIHIDSVDAAAKDGIPDTILTDLVAVITAGENQTLQACYTVPNGFNALLTQFCTTNINTAANVVGTFRLRKSVEGAASRVQEILEIAESVYQCTPHDPPILFAEKTDIELTSDMSGNNGSATGTFDLILAPETMR